MSPHPSITTAALLPRQTGLANDPYGLTSLYNQITEMYPSSLYPDLYQTTSNYAFSGADYSSIYNSILVDYSAIFSSLLGTNTDFASFTVPSFGDPSVTGLGAFPTVTAPGASRSSARSSSPTSVGASGSSSSDSDSGGLSTGAKIGIGVGVTLGVLLLASLGLFLWCMGKRKGKKTSTTIVAPSQTNFTPQQQQQHPPPPQQQPQMGYANSNQGYGQGVQQPMVTPPPQYAQPHPPPAQPMQDYMGAYGAAGKGPAPGVSELEQEYHFAKPGAVELGDGVPDAQQQAPRK